MRDVLQAIWEIILAITGTLAIGALTVAAIVALMAVGVMCALWLGFDWRRKLGKRRRPDRPADE